jgi:hypothetical protein
LAHFAVRAVEPWQSAVDQMPLGANVTELNRTNCVNLMLHSFRSNDVVKALIFMPGATDEFYFFRRAKAVLTNGYPSLLDAVTALTNQTLICATFQSPLLVLHTDEDPLNVSFVIKDPDTLARIQQSRFVPHALYNDRDWDFLLPILKKSLRVRFSPKSHTTQSWHFYRHSFAAWNLNGWEALETIAMAGKTKFTVEKKHITFTGDERVLAVPKIDHYPK